MLLLAVCGSSENRLETTMPAWSVFDIGETNRRTLLMFFFQGAFFLTMGFILFAHTMLLGAEMFIQYYGYISVSHMIMEDMYS